MHSKTLTVDEAAAIALQALAFLAEDEERLTRFLGLTGNTPENLRAEAKNVQFQAAILEYLLSDESLLLVFCAHSGIDPSLIHPAQYVLDPVSNGDI